MLGVVGGCHLQSRLQPYQEIWELVHIISKYELVKRIKKFICTVLKLLVVDCNLILSCHNQRFFLVLSSIFQTEEAG
jgi:hypothetical protein